MSANITNTVRTKTIAIGAASFLALGGALTLGATSPASAAPIGANAIALNEAAPANVIDVRRRGRRGHRWHGHRHGGGWGRHAVAGLALGIIGAGVASHYYGGYPYGYGHYGYYPRHRYYHYGW